MLQAKGRSLFIILVVCLSSTTLLAQDYAEVFVEKKDYEIPRLILKISPLHLFGEHPFNRFPSINIGLEQRLKKGSQTLYHEIGFLSQNAGVSVNGIVNFITNDEFGDPWDDMVIRNRGFRLREQYRSYFKSGKKAAVFIGVEGYYMYQNTELGEWAFVNDNTLNGWGFEKYYTFNRIKQVAAINPIVGFMFFSKNTEYSNGWNKFMNQITMDLYAGLGIRFITRENRNIPNDVDNWSGDEFFFLDGLDDDVEGNFFTPSFTLGYKIGYIISK